jgi:hypothetical protein
VKKLHAGITADTEATDAAGNTVEMFVRLKSSQVTPFLAAFLCATDIRELLFLLMSPFEKGGPRGIYKKLFIIIKSPLTPLYQRGANLTAIETLNVSVAIDLVMHLC